MNGNVIHPVLLPNLIRTSKFIPDSISPSLTSFTANLNDSLLTLHFSETVNTSSLVIHEITLLPMSSSIMTNDSVQLTDTFPFPEGSFTPSENDISLQIYLGSLDLNRIKQLINLFTSISDSYLSLSYISILDMSGNFISPISESNALQVFIFIHIMFL